MLAFLLKQDSFIFTARDLCSFVAMALARNWIAGLKNILWSTAAHITLQSQSFEQQTEFVASLLDKVDQEQHFKPLIEETLSKRPYSKHLILTLIQKNGELHEAVKIVTLCLKTLVAEDFFMLNEYKATQVEEAKKQFEGDLGEEMKKIIRRFLAEGVPSERKSQKQVRFCQQQEGQGMREELKMQDAVEGVLEKEEEQKQEEAEHQPGEPKKEGGEEQKPEGEEAKAEDQEPKAEEGGAEAAKEL